jgi:hypothetical protein
MIRIIKTKISNNLINIPGWKTNRKIIVIESDDWGSIRMPSKEIYSQFLKLGIRVDNDPYCRYDCLASKQDLELLFEVLFKFRDNNGRNPIITANSVLTNPDFKKIRESDFSQYYYETFLETLKRSELHNKSFELWKEGINAGVFRPQFHGREHLNIDKWMSNLRAGHSIIRTAFDLGTFGLTQNVDKSIENCMGAFKSSDIQSINTYNSILSEGLSLFQDFFGYKSLSFIAPQYTWHPSLEDCLKTNGVKYLQGMVVQKIPLDNGNNFKFKRNNFLGTYSKNGLMYLMRNSYFEPSINPNIDWVDYCLERIKIAFKWHKPVIISMHRLNFIGVIDSSNRDRNLRLLFELLNNILKYYPDAEFFSSDELGELISSEQKKNN